MSENGSHSKFQLRESNEKTAPGEEHVSVAWTLTRRPCFLLSFHSLLLFLLHLLALTKQHP